MNRITKRFQALHETILHHRQKRITEACNLWRKCHIAAIQSPNLYLISDAILFRNAWKQLATQIKQLNEATAFD